MFTSRSPHPASWILHLTILLFTFLFCGFLQRIEAQRAPQNTLKEEDIIRVKEEIEVPFGRSVYLHPQLQLNIQQRPGDRCTVKVIENDPLSQRPGRLTPANFPCQFGHEEVQYSHFGSRSPPQDKVKLMVRYDSADDTLILPVILNVQILFEQLEIVTKNLPLVVDNLGGISNPIDSRVLQFSYDKTSQECRVTALNKVSALPRYGELVNGNFTGVMHDCDEFFKSGVQYQHTSPHASPNQDFIPMVVELTDLIGEVVKREYFQVVVKIKGGEENTAPTVSFSALLLMDVNQFVMTAITPNILSAEDLETPADEIIFNILKVWGPEEGSIVSTDDQNVPITSFFQKDIKDLKIAYKPPASDSDVRRFVTVEMVALDSEGTSSEPIVLTIVVNPMNTLAPLATKNTGLVLFEGQSRRLQSSKNLQISDENNIDDVTISVVGGLRHGRFSLMGIPVKQFTPGDLDSGLIIYEHDGSDTYSDNVIFRLDDGQHLVEFLFPISIYPEDDEPPTLNVNTGLTITRGEEVEITPFVLSATDVDSDDSSITFRLVPHFSIGGEIIKKLPDAPEDIDNWNYTGDMFERSVQTWTQQDLSEGSIYYRHSGDPVFKPTTEKIRFTVSDDNIPPNESEIQEFIIRVMPMDDAPPELYPGTDLQMAAKESEITDITQQHLHYIDDLTSPQNLLIQITQELYDTDVHDPSEPGKIVYSDYSDKEVTTFTQAQINHRKIAYKAPLTEMGLNPRTIKFHFNVTDNAGNSLSDQIFTIFLHPVDNKSPVVRTEELSVIENGYAALTADVLDASDEDTDPSRLVFAVRKVPKHGTLEKENDILEIGDFFTNLDVSRGIVKYVHNGSEASEDEFELELTDGVHKVPFSMHVTINNIDDEAPHLSVLSVANIGVYIEVDEGGRGAIKSDSVGASDPDTDDSLITFILENLPEHGSIEVNGIVSDRFTQDDIKKGKVFYVHDGIEVGGNGTLDFFNLTVTDLSNNWIANGDGPVKIPVVISIKPVDNFSPQVEIGFPLSVHEANRSTITLHQINVTDLDTPDTDITCTIVSQPAHGYVENISPAPGSEKPRIGMATISFTVSDLKSDSINYVQSIHKGVEPVADEFSFICSDGVNVSPEWALPIQINPTNDEVPEIYIREFIVDEGMELVIDLPILNAIDMDIPPDPLTFIVTKEPTHGTIAFQMPTGTVPVRNFTLDQISRGSTIVYQHDDTETTKDIFELTVTDGLHDSSRLITVMVLPVDDETPRLVVNDGLDIKIGEFKLITNKILKAEDLDSEDGNITYVIRQLPVHGFISYLDSSGVPLYNLTQGMNFTQSDIDNELIMYTHEGQEGVRDLIKFDVTDGYNPFIDRYFWITVEGVDTIYPEVINKGLELPEGGRASLSTDVLSTSDLNSDDELLLFIITREPTEGHLERSDAPGMPVTSFSQMDLAGNKIFYVHTSDDEVKEDSFEFEVSDGYNLIYRTFRITITEVDNKKPVLYFNRLRVLEGGERLITPFELRAEDQDTADENIVFIITDQPMHGKVLRGKLDPVATFTMAEVVANNISYKHDGSETKDDTLSFVVTDSTHESFFVHPNVEKETSKPVVLEIDILPVDNLLPRISLNRGGSYLSPLDYGRLGYQITNKVLKAEDVDSPASELEYIITEQPKHGILINSLLGNQSITSFTQGDINNKAIQYVLNDDVNVTSDKFRFKIQDPGKNELADQVFRLNWAWITVEKDTYRVNETEEYFQINLLRKGYLGETSFVGVKLKNITAHEGLDFSNFYAHQVQFNPGQAEAKWQLRILDDKIFEKEEAFVFSLEDPISAALGDPQSAQVVIHDEEDQSTAFIPEDSYEIMEDFEEFLVPIKRTGDLSKEMVVICATESGSATGTSQSVLSSNSDYISRQEDHTSILYFLKDEHIQFCSVKIIDDSLYEEEEFFVVKLATVNGGRIGTFNETVIKILPDSNDVPSIYFKEAKYYTDESDGFVEISVVRSGTDLRRPSSVTVQTGPSDPVSAEAGVDYAGTTCNLDFAPHEKIQKFKVNIIDDLGHPELEGSETFEVFLRMPMNATLGDPLKATVVINDSISDVPKFQFKESQHKVSENETEVSVVIVRSGDLKHSAAVRCYTRQASAKVMDDFHERPNTDDSIITFGPGETEKLCKVYLVDDNEFEPDEEFRLVLGSPTSDALTGATIGQQDFVIVSITDVDDKPIIQLEKTRYTIKEPHKIPGVATVKIPLIRTGDLSKSSRIRVHTKDLSAKSGMDYVPYSGVLEFGHNVSQVNAEIRVLYDEEKEHWEAFSLQIIQDLNAIAEIRDTKAIIYIHDRDILADVTFPTHPIVVSLRDYDDAAKARKNPTPGYPVVCITPCNPKHPDFGKTGTLCVKEKINDTLTEYRWKVAPPNGQDGVAYDLKDVESATFFSGTHGVTLDSIYFAAGSQVQCVARAVSIEGDSGLELSSPSVTISEAEGLCMPRSKGVVGAELFTAKMRYTGPNDPEYPNLVKLTVTIPHWDGMLPVISTRKLTNFELTLSPDSFRLGIHKCSNLLDFYEVPTKHGFLTNSTMNPDTVGEVEPYQYSSEMRSKPTLRFYRNLNLEACIWEFTSYYDTSELISECGGTITSDGQVLNLVQSYVSVRVPLYVSYIFYSPMAVGGWQHNDLSSQLKLTFVYDTSVLWQQGISAVEGGSRLKGYLYPTRMAVREDGRLLINFKTEAHFRGQFVLSHPGSSFTSMVMNPDHPDLTFTLDLLHSEPTFSQPKQDWSILSDYASRDYSGVYHIKLIPCIALTDGPYSEPIHCNPVDPMSFTLNVRFQQVSDPVPTEYSLNTQLNLMKDRALWLSDKSAGFVADSDTSFLPGDTVYGKVMIDPVQNLGESFVVNIEKCFLCTGVDGYVPKYDPESSEYGCVGDSANLLHSFKIIDKNAPHSVTDKYRNIPFKASLVANDPSEDVKALRRQPSVDGFHFRSDPLFQVSYGRQWFVQCIYTVHSRKSSHAIGKRDISSVLSVSGSLWRAKRFAEDDLLTEDDTREGTNMNQLILDYSNKTSALSQDSISTAIFGDTTTSLIVVAATLGLVAFVLMLLLFYKHVNNREKKVELSPQISSDTTHQDSKYTCNDEAFYKDFGFYGAENCRQMRAANAEEGMTMLKLPYIHTRGYHKYGTYRMTKREHSTQN